MNRYDSDPSVLMTPAESAVYSELVETIAKDFNGKISHCQIKVTVRYPGLSTVTTFTCNWLETATRIIARSRHHSCPVTYRITLKPEYRVEHFARRPQTLKQAIAQMEW